MNQFEEKKQIIQRELRQINFPPNCNPTEIQQYIYQFLDQKSHKMFDRDIGEQLFDRMTYQKDPIEEFTDIFMEAEFILKNKIEHTKKYLEDYHKQKRETLFQLQEAQQNEQMNNYGINVDSQIMIRVISAKSFQSFKNLPDAYVVLSCGSQRHETVIGKKENREITWNEGCKFDIQTGNEEINIVILHFDQQTRDNFIGTVIIPVNRLRDQQKVVETMELYQQDGIIGSDIIQLEMQWIHSKVIYLADVLRQWDKHIQTQEDDLIDYERDLSELYTPFEDLIQYYQQNLYNRAQLKTEQSAREYGENLRDSQPVVVQNKQKKYEKLSAISPYISSVFVGVQKDIFTGVRLAVGIQILLVVFVNYFRPAFMDLLICLLFFAFYDLFILDYNKIYFIGALYQVSFVMDIFWLWIYSKHWWDGGNDPYTDFKLEQGIKQFDVTLSYIAFFFKLPILVGLYFLYLKIKKNMDNVKLEKKEVVQTTNFFRNELMVSQSPMGLSMAPQNFQSVNSGQKSFMKY